MDIKRIEQVAKASRYVASYALDSERKETHELIATLAEQLLALYHETHGDGR